MSATFALTAQLIACRSEIPPNANIHKIDEYIALADIESRKNIRCRVLKYLHRQVLT